MVKFWSHSGMLTVNSRMYFIKVMESGTEEKTTISAGNSICMVDLVELNHMEKTLTVFSHDDSLEYVIEWAKQLYHTYSQEGIKVA